MHGLRRPHRPGVHAHIVLPNPARQALHVLQHDQAGALRTRQPDSQQNAGQSDFDSGRCGRVGELLIAGT